MLLLSLHPTAADFFFPLRAYEFLLGNVIKEKKKNAPTEEAQAATRKRAEKSFHVACKRFAPFVVVSNSMRLIQRTLSLQLRCEHTDVLSSIKNEDD